MLTVTRHKVLTMLGLKLGLFLGGLNPTTDGVLIYDDSCPTVGCGLNLSWHFPPGAIVDGNAFVPMFSVDALPPEGTPWFRVMEYSSGIPNGPWIREAGPACYLTITNGGCDPTHYHTEAP